MKRGILAYVGIGAIIAASAYGNYVSKLPKTLYYAIFIIGAVLIVLGNMKRK